MLNNKIRILEKALERERKARKEAEEILEKKSFELYETNKHIEELYDDRNAQLKLIVDNSSLGIILSQNGKLVTINRALVKLLGYSYQDLMAMNISDDLTHPDDVKESDYQTNLLETNKIDRFSLQKRYLRKDGSYVLCKTNVSAVRNSKGEVKYQVALIENVTEINKKTKMLNTLNRLSASILGKRDLYEISWEIAKTTAEHLQLEDCVVYSVNLDTGILTQIATASHSMYKGNDKTNLFELTTEEGIVGKAVRTGEYQLVNDTSKCSDYLVDASFRFSELAVPIIANGKVIGVMDSENSKKNYFNYEHVEVFKNIASLASAQFNSAISMAKERKTQLEKDKLLIKLEKNNEELKNFAHVVSHDLKSPLRSMSALISWIKEDNDDIFDDETSNNCNLLLAKIHKMDSLINGILKYSSIDKIEKEYKNVNIQQVVKEIIETIFIPDTINIDIKNELPTIPGDKFRYQQLFQNLISNAIKYNDKEKGIIEIDVQEKKDTYVFSVKDNGMGIDQKYHTKIFEVFETLGQHNDNSTGIGLSIVKKIIDLYEGKIWIESESNKGTKFLFQLHKKPL
ncbi:PAS domain S-box-containing protein [Tenacibaculum sp. MAR_2009_124]|uniref:ATP-binding protein n=1 Tax=Tenacibaculum sp. MAR_2009_124 TaxID=1250059 RepID=UPI0008977C23|nr:ATP-binding protein [Tenacibaculum sp. MAR_2009_124]SEB50599.1 PAS domain S-box-containing protein [Tenacibaculum sp. MAR_2009_124]